MNENEILRKLQESVIAGDEQLAKEAAEKALEEGINPVKAIDEGLAVGMQKIEDFEAEKIYLPEVMLAAEALKVSMEILLARLKPEETPHKGKVVIGTIKGDIHDLGKNLVSAMFKTAGFEVSDLGKDVDPKTLIGKAREVNADIIAGSALMSTTMVYLADLSKLLKDMGTREQFKIMVGGGAVTQTYADKIDADGTGKTRLKL